MTESVMNQVEEAGLTKLFGNGGEMGTRIQAFDWSITPLGAVETWDQSLRIALQILLSSKFPMQILWGAEYIQFYNDAYIDIAGGKHPEALGQRGADCWEEVWEFAGPLLDQVMTTGKATWSEDQLLILNRHGYPEECYFTFSYTPVWSEAGTIGGVFIAVNETTEKILSERRERTLRAETQAAKEEAEQANRLKDQFLTILSHELRSPLNPILGWAQLLLAGKVDAATTQRALEVIERNAKLQTQLIDDLMDVSRILRNKLVLEPTPIYLIPIIEGALETVQSTATAKAIQIQTQLEPTQLQVLGDANRLKQAVWNLLSNAVKFTPAGGRVTLRLSYTEEVAQLQVIDTGRGIGSEFLSAVFEPFCQADTTTTRTFGGLGLGLAIAKQVVDMHDGTIEVTSPGADQGSTFTITLPLITEPVEVIEAATQSVDWNTLDGIHVLVVEDDADSREIIEFTLEQSGAKVTTRHSAAEGINAWLTSQPDILISDMGMAEIDGYTMMRQLRSLAQTDQIPAIALTAYVSEIERQKAFAAGFQAHLPKPMEPTKLIETICSLLETTRAKTDHPRV